MIGRASGHEFEEDEASFPSRSSWFLVLAFSSTELFGGVIRKAGAKTAHRVQATPLSRKAGEDGLTQVISRK